MFRDARENQLELFKKHGGPRKGAGRPRVAVRSSTEHRSRAGVNRHEPLHVTLRMREGLPSLRGRKGRRAFVGACADGKERFGMRVVHWSVQRDHVHLIVEADDSVALARGMTGLSVRFVRRLNRELGRTGSALGDRYHARVLKSPREVRETVRYVLANARHHASGPARGVAWIDPWSSGAWFDGWRDGHELAARLARELDAEGLLDVVRRRRRRATAHTRQSVAPEVTRDAPVAAPGLWLLRAGWARAGLLSCTDAPA